jgi:hypothetical protein
VIGSRVAPKCVVGSGSRQAQQGGVQCAVPVPNWPLALLPVHCSQESGERAECMPYTAEISPSELNAPTVASERSAYKKIRPKLAFLRPFRRRMPVNRALKAAQVPCAFFVL